MRLDRGRQHIERFHSLVVAAHVVLHHFHRLKLLEPCFFGDFVLAVVSIVLQVPHIGDIAHITHLVAQMCQIAVDDIERYCRACMAEMTVAVDRRATHIHADTFLMQRFENLFLPRHGVIDSKHFSSLEYIVSWIDYNAKCDAAGMRRRTSVIAFRPQMGWVCRLYRAWDFWASCAR